MSEHPPPVDPDDGDHERGAYSMLRSMLAGQGTDDAEIARAEADGTLTLLAVDRLAGPEPPTLSLGDVSHRTGLPEELLGELWRTLGYPEPEPDEPAFAESDLDILAKVGDLVAADPRRAALVLQVGRVMGSSIARLASAWVDVVGRGPAARVGGTELPVNEEVMEAMVRLLPVMPRALELSWRRHLQAAARRRIIQVTGDEGTRLVVGFADLVGFTALSQQVDEVELADIVGQFEALVFDVITSGAGRVVKTIGDEVMFSVRSCEAAAEIALALVEGTRASDELSDVRVGLAVGPVLAREGDIYGPVVNLASRLTVVALPGTVVVAPEVAESLAGYPDYTLRAMRPRYLKDIGRLRLFALRRSQPVEGRFADRRQALRDAVRARLDPTT